MSEADAKVLKERHSFISGWRGLVQVGLLIYDSDTGRVLRVTALKSKGYDFVGTTLNGKYTKGFNFDTCNWRLPSNAEINRSRRWAV